MGPVVRVLVVFVLAALSLAGCGVRGPLEPPPGAVAEPQSGSAPASGSGEDAPNKPFVLDGLL